MNVTFTIILVIELQRIGLPLSFYPKIRQLFLCGCVKEGLDKSFVQIAFLFQRYFHAVDTPQCIGEHCCAQQVQPAVASLI